METEPLILWRGLEYTDPSLANTTLASAPGAAHFDRLPVAGPQEALIVCFDAKSHEGSRGDVPPVPSCCHALPALGKQGERRQMRLIQAPGSPKRRGPGKGVDTHMVQEATRRQGPVGHVVGAGVSQFKGDACVPPAPKLADVDDSGLGMGKREEKRPH